MTADGPLSVGRARVRGRCVCQRPDDAEAVRKPRTRAERRALDPELEAVPDRGAGWMTSPVTFQGIGKDESKRWAILGDKR